MKRNWKVVESISGWTDIENPYIDYREVIYIYVCVEFLASHFNDLFCCISKFTRWAIVQELSIRRRLRTFLISWGQKTRETLLCWFIVMTWALVCNIMCRYECHFGSFYRNPTILETVSIASKGVNMGNLFYWNTMTGNNSSTDVSLSMQNVKIYCKEIFFTFQVCLQEWSQTWYSDELIAQCQHSQQSEPQTS